MKSIRLLALTTLAFVATAASARVTEKFTQTYPIDADGIIHVENVNGTVEIIAWNKAEVSIVAEKSAKNQEGLDRMHLKIESSNRRLYIKTEYEKKWKFWDNMNAQVHYQLMVPAGVTLDKIDVVNANIRVSGVTGTARLATVNGNIDAKGLSATGKFSTVNGSVHVTYAGWPTGGEIHLETVNGSCSLTVPANAGFDLDADTVNGRVSCDFPITLEKSGRRELRGTVNGGGILLRLESVNGSLDVERGG